MSKTKIVFRIISFILFVGYLTSCKNDHQDETTTSEVLQVSKKHILTLNSTNTNAKILNDKYTLWNSNEGEDIYFSRNQKTVKIINENQKNRPNYQIFWMLME